MEAMRSTPLISRFEAGSNPSEANGLAILSKWGPLLIISLAMVTMFGWTWGRWADPYIDLGRELYVPWQLAAGKVLYRDIAHFNGPLSPYFNALWFRIFGPGFGILAAVNCGVIIAITALLFNVLSYLADRLSATLASLVFICLFAFGIFLPLGNYTYVAPYSHEMTHGILLCFALVAALCRFFQTRQGVYIFLMALCAGLLFLTKMEMCMAALFTSLAGLILAIWPMKTEIRNAGRLVGLYVLGVLIPPVSAFLLLSLAMPADQALCGILSPIMGFTHNEVMTMPFYKNLMGLDAPMKNLAIMARMTLGYLFIFLPMIAGAMLLGRSSRIGRIIGLLLAVTPPVLFCALHSKIIWDQIARPYGLLLFCCLVWLLERAWKQKHHTLEAMGVCAGRIALTILALSLLPKMGLCQRITMYGFGLGMPGTMVLIALLTSWLPRSIKMARGSGLSFLLGAMSIILVTAGTYLYAEGFYLKPKVHVLGTGSDVIYWDVRAVSYGQVLEILEKKVPPGKTMAVLPACAIFNYLGRIPNSTPYITVLPPEMIIFGENNIVSSYKEAPPDFILFVHHDNIEYGFRYFGRDYGKELFAWIMGNYEEVAGLGPRPFQGSEGGFLLLKQNHPLAASG
ncbi:MAG: hypothetical protein JEZ02_14210 [Desulfatibacillum sp.]|nr:hypothetical protein [Desulfatibacillum sp.]